MANCHNNHIDIYAYANFNVRHAKMKDSVDNLIAYCAVIAVAVVCFFGGRYVGAHQSGYYDLEQQLKSFKETHIAAFDVLHRVWLDNPQYVEDVLFETDEFVKLSNSINDDFEDVFYFWDEQDSITYQKSLSREQEQAAAVLKYYGEASDED